MLVPVSVVIVFMLMLMVMIMVVGVFMMIVFMLMGMFMFVMFVFMVMFMFMMLVIMFRVFFARIHNGAGTGDPVPFFPAEFQFPAFKAEFVKFAHKRGGVRPRVNKGAKGHVA
jgi:hypothetical protein